MFCNQLVGSSVTELQPQPQEQQDLPEKFSQVNYIGEMACEWGF